MLSATTQSISVARGIIGRRALAPEKLHVQTPVKGRVSKTLVPPPRMSTAVLSPAKRLQCRQVPQSPLSPSFYATRFQRRNSIMDNSSTFGLSCLTADGVNLSAFGEVRPTSEARPQYPIPEPDGYVVLGDWLPRRAMAPRPQHEYMDVDTSRNVSPSYQPATYTVDTSNLWMSSMLTGSYTPSAKSHVNSKLDLEQPLEVVYLLGRKTRQLV